MKISVFRLNYGKGSFFRAFTGAVAQMSALCRRQWPVLKNTGREILGRQLMVMLVVIGLTLWAIPPLTEPLKALARSRGAWLPSVQQPVQSTPAENKVTAVELQSPDILKASEARRPRVMAVHPLPMPENTEQVVVISVEVPRPDGEGFYTKKQWVRFMSHPRPLETPELSEPRSHF